jgi:hypothetical protein
MLRQFSCFVLLSGVLGLAEQGHAFVLKGPLTAWQTENKSYFDTDLGGPQQMGEEFRYTTPFLTYGFDSSFLNYFGSNGVVAVDQAMEILNALPEASDMSRDLTEFPTRAERINFRAQALNIIDLKSWALSAMMEQLGLAEPERFVWTLRSRVPVPPVQCYFQYNVVKRNYDPVSWQPSSYVNGHLYSYVIVEGCPAIEQADAAEFPVDPQSPFLSAVASFRFNEYGGFFTGLTRDDVGGLRYLLRPDNLNNELLPNGSAVVGFSGGGDSGGGLGLGGGGFPWDPVFFTNLLGTNVSIPTNTLPGGPTAGGLATNFVVLRTGVDKITLVRADFDSLLGGFFVPITNVFNSTIIINGTQQSQTVLRLLTRPDIVFAAGDLTLTDVGGGQFGFPYFTRSLSFNTNGVTTNASVGNVGAAVNGPGSIEPPTIIIFNNSGPSFQNDDAFFFDEQRQIVNYVWGSYDGTTNAPKVFPDGRTVEDLERAVLGGGGIP